MKITSKKALELLEQSKGMAPDDYWIDHCILVGDTAAIIAEKLGLDVEKTKALGYIHDIGKRNGFGKNAKHHAIGGYEYLLELGFDEDYANICLTHSYLNNDINCVCGGIPSPTRYRYDFIKEFIKNHKYTEEEKLINLCDLFCKTNIQTLEKRIVGIIIKRGVFDNTVYHLQEAQKLKKYFDDKLGYDLYSLFPNIEL